MTPRNEPGQGWQEFRHGAAVILGAKEKNGLTMMPQAHPAQIDAIRCPVRVAAARTVARLQACGEWVTLRRLWLAAKLHRTELVVANVAASLPDFESSTETIWHS